MAQLVEAGVPEAQAEVARVLEVLGDVRAEDLHGPLDARARGDGGLGGSAEVRVIEVDEAVRGGAHLAALAHLLPVDDRALRAHDAEHLPDGVAVADDDAVDAAHLARLGADVEAAGGADERHRRLVAGAGDLERGRAAGIRESARGQERSPPDGGDLLARARGEPVRQAADGAAPRVEQAGLAGEGLAALHHADQVVGGAAHAGCGDDRDVAAHPVELGQVLADATGEERGVELGLDRDAVRDEVQPTREAQDGGQLGGPHRGLADLDA